MNEKSSRSTKIESILETVVGAIQEKVLEKKEMNAEELSVTLDLLTKVSVIQRNLTFIPEETPETPKGIKNASDEQLESIATMGNSGVVAAR